MQGNKFLITIIIPHYNSEEKLLRLLNSIYQEKLRDILEVIVVDDKSTKSINQIIEFSKLHENFILLKNNTEFKGAGTCRNIGISKSSGKWILFADSDDFFLPGFLSVLEKTVEDHQQIIYFIPTSINDDTGKPSNRHEYFEEIMTSDIPEKELYLKFKIVVPWSKVYLRQFILEEQIIFDNTLVSNDVMFSSRCGVNVSHMKLSSDKIYCVTKSEGTLTTSVSKESYFQRLSVFIKSCAYIKNNISEQDYKKLDLNAFQFILNMYVYNLTLKDKIHAISMLKKAEIKIIPWNKISIKRIKKNVKRVCLELRYRIVKD